MFTHVSYLPTHINLDLHRFDRSNIWQGIFPKSLSDWISYKHRKEAWLGKFSIKCILALRTMWIERCDICHKSNNTMIRAEDHDVLKLNIANALESHAELPNTLESHRVKLDLMSS